MTKLHSITFEEVDQYYKGTGVFYTIYLFHREPSYPLTDPTGHFDVCEHNPFKTERSPFFTIGSTTMRIADYSTDVPIVIERESNPIAILMPGARDKSLLTTCAPCEHPEQKIIGIMKESVLYFREF
jgi:hypothetical protein